MRSVMGAALVFLAVAGSAVAADTGQSLYNDNCSACHQKTGLGVKGAFPALAGDKLVKGPAPLLVTTVLNGDEYRLAAARLAVEIASDIDSSPLIPELERLANASDSTRTAGTT